ncbi:hypothetical protein PR048_001536 [Dryococelus australis]|uniref:Uncharacterized protein n=1 Tax=Dryococelus australis TaxID=614101 RepID=A0ABQ9IHM7_9NEOP|nr:hypothetical protein PR048_001536 [Dryococelus australis]
MNEGVKKNVFTSWGWGAGGMPFSVLYLNRKSRVHYPPKAGQPLSETMPQPLAMTAEHPQDINYQMVSPRNTLGTRRHYSIIPQLFVSYGWGPIGK